MRNLEARGFTLIELLIAVVIVAILTTVALPGYLEHTAKARRAEGRNALLKAAQLQERFYSTRVPTTADPIRYARNAELPALFGLAGGPVYSGEDPALATGSYVITVDAATGACPEASCFVVRATPNGRHAPDAKCAALTLSSTGVRNKTGAEPLDYCWGK